MRSSVFVSLVVLLAACGTERVGNDDAGGCESADPMQCPEGTVLRPETGVCVTDCREQREVCASSADEDGDGEVDFPHCDVATGLCVAEPACLQDQVFSPQMGSCVPDCRVQDMCANSQDRDGDGAPDFPLCDPVIGLCMPDSPACTTDADCPDDQKCSQRNLCVVPQS